MKELIVEKLVLGEIQTNTYIVTRKSDKTCIIIDPAAEAKRIVNRIKEEELTPQAILLTHGHCDHIMAMDEVRDVLHIPVYAYKDEEATLADVTLNASNDLFGKSITTHADHYLLDKEEIMLLGRSFYVLATPGHTKGSCCFYVPSEKLLFSGDTLFLESFGRFDMPGGDMKALEESLIKTLFVLPDDTQVYPGHMEETTIGHEKKYNPVNRYKI